MFEFGKYVLYKINHIVCTRVELNFFQNTMVKYFNGAENYFKFQERQKVGWGNIFVGDDELVYLKDKIKNVKIQN